MEIQILNIYNIQSYFLLHLFFCNSLIQMISRVSLLLLVGLVLQATSLHLQDSTQAQIDALKAQQSSFEKNVNKLITNISQVEKAVANTTNIDQKVLLLENAITSERETVFELSKIIIPPFNISKDGCEKMTDQQKVELLDQLSQARKQIYQLRNLTYTMPVCDDVETMKRDIEKQIFFLNSIESIIYTNCTMNVILSPTIFQTNIYATNWTLGNLTIDDLIEQYYQRSIRYDNITNCPIQYPFFNGKECIQCPASTPVFDISQKTCYACPYDYHVDNSQKKCVPNAHYTNWTDLTNYYPATGPFPLPPDDATPCNSSFPYFNGTSCSKCQLPKYFDIASQTCKRCPSGQAFDLSEKQCEGVIKNMLTKLSGTRWVTPTNNFTNVLRERAAILEDNQTTGIYTECPDQYPYYDSITCINCDHEFNLNTLQCVQAPNGSKFDPNIHVYLAPQTAETLPTANNLIGTPPADDPKIANCNSTAPYWDGVACIMCPEPFVLFQLSTKTCVVCDPKDQYDAQKRACIPRPVIYISSNENNLMATPNRSINDYHDNVTKTIQNNPNAILLNCENSTQYSDYKSCFTCNSGEYFNVQTFKCQICPNTYDPVTKLCKKPVYTFTNLNAPNIVNLADPVKQNQTITAALKENNQSKICDISTPYWNGTKCITCPIPNIFFDYISKQCVGCPDNSYLNNSKCVSTPLVTNVPAIVAANNYIQTPPHATLANENKTVQDMINSQTPYRECPATSPLYNATTKTCRPQCPSGTFLNLANGTCIVCPTYVSSNHTCPPPVPPIPHYPNLNNTKWVSNNVSSVVEWRDMLSKQPKAEVCPITQPYYDNFNCLNCSAGQIFNYDTLKCQSCSPQVFDQNVYRCLSQLPANTSQTNINTSGVIYGGTPRAQWQQYYDANVTAGAKDCPAEAPYYDGINCIKCFDGLYFNLESRTCMKCPENTVYTELEKWKGCVDPTGRQIAINPDIAKMYANIF